MPPSRPSHLTRTSNEYGRQTELNSRTYLPMTAMQLWENLPQILLGAFFFSVASAPSFVLFVLGLPWLALLCGIGLVSPAWVGLLAYEGVLARGYTGSASLLLFGFRHRWLDSLRLGAVGAFPLATALWFALSPNDDLTPLASSVWVLLILLACLILVIVTIYALPLLALFDAPVTNALQNSVILSARYVVNTLGLAALAVLLAFGVIYLSLGLLLILPACFALFVVNNCFLVVHAESTTP
ncbi:MAG TPA: hypothetical protein GYA08_08710 [Chloroflexi bacterium]|nr:hypothetical protein [Chloroflexota bacterium]